MQLSLALKFYVLARNEVISAIVLQLKQVPKRLHGRKEASRGFGMAIICGRFKPCTECSTWWKETQLVNLCGL
jgi:hypothetical protein